MRINDREVLVSFKTMKNLRMRLSREGRVLVSAPRGTSTGRIRDFVQGQETWLSGAEEAVARQARDTWRFESGLVDYLGRPCRIEMKAARKKEVLLKEGVITLYLPDPGDAGAAEALLKAFLKSQAAGVFKALLGELAMTGADYPWEDITLKPYAMKKRLGTCYPDRGLIHLNTRLIHSDPEAIRYVLWHEIVHLKHPDHGRGFYEELGRRCPRHRERKKLLEDQLKGYL